MRKAILIAASALALSSPAVAADLQVTPYSEGPSYEREVYPYAYRPAPPVFVEETFVVRRPVVVGPPPVVVEEYPIRSMRHRQCMRPRMQHRLCMRTPVRVGGADGAIDVTSAAVGKVSDLTIPRPFADNKSLARSNKTALGRSCTNGAGEWDFST